MSTTFKILPASEVRTILPLLKELGSADVSEEILEERLLEMTQQQHYECIGIFDESTLVGACGMWFQTRHYAGKSVEVDHVIITASHRSKGLGKLLMEFVYAYARSKNCNWVELNTYVDNFPSHKFYNNEGFIAKGYHFVKQL